MKNKFQKLKNESLNNQIKISQYEEKNKLIENKIELANKKKYVFKNVKDLSTNWELVDEDFSKSWEIEIGQLDIRLLPFIKVEFLMRNQGGNSDDEAYFGPFSFGYFFEVNDILSEGFIKDVILRACAYPQSNGTYEHVWSDLHEIKLNIGFNNPYNFI